MSIWLTEMSLCVCVCVCVCVWLVVLLWVCGVWLCGVVCVCGCVVLGVVGVCVCVGVGGAIGNQVCTHSCILMSWGLDWRRLVSITCPPPTPPCHIYFLLSPFSLLFSFFLHLVLLHGLLELFDYRSD